MKKSGKNELVAITIKRITSQALTLYFKTKFWLINKPKPTPINIVESEPFDETFWNRWNNGWYVNGGGNDPRKLYRFHNGNIETRKGEMFLKSHASPFSSGCMIYSKAQFLYGTFRMTYIIQQSPDEEFAFWLKSYKYDVNEIDIVENLAENKYTFTGHTGTNYNCDHAFWPTTINYLFGTKVTVELEWTPKKLVWRMNGRIVKIQLHNIPDEPMGIIINFGKSDYSPISNAANITELIIGY